MKKTKVTRLLTKLIDMASPTGSETRIAMFLANHLEKVGFVVERMPVEGNRFNVFAKVGNPKIILQAHMDVVPPHIPPREDNEYIYGRGACDTKGSIASMLIAAQEAKEKGITNFGVLFTVGEETDFAGAIAAQHFVRDLNALLIVGEPTQLKPVTAHYGILVFTLKCTGKAAHSSEPTLGENAIDKLLTVLNGPAKQLQVNPATSMSLVKIVGGGATNSIPDCAEAVISFRIAPGDTRDYAQEMKKLVGTTATINILENLPPVASSLPQSLKFLGDGEQVKYCTELTFFQNGFVFGPGAIADAHASNEKIQKADLETAVDLYVRVLQEYRQT